MSGLEASRGELAAVRPEGWPRPIGYADGISARGRTLFVSGQVGWDPLTRRIESDDFVAQAERAFGNLLAVLAAGGAEPRHVARLTWFITDREAYLAARPALGALWRRTFGAHYPAMSVAFVVGLVEERALLELEATAVVPE